VAAICTAFGEGDLNTGRPGRASRWRRIDAPVVALGERLPLRFSNSQPDLSAGIHSSLFNNAWGTNYIMWYAEDMRFRYIAESLKKAAIWKHIGNNHPGVSS
jgi:hypothetical protein